ncbi:MAG TPA: 4-alpha-glucanotransferase [Acidimicrobiales bacterium]|nr:4-alpha-glucanotransferase [Acidimicrobiales bacterium]
MATDPWGIDDGYHDVHGVWHPTPPETRTALRAAMHPGGDPEAPPPAHEPLWVVRAGATEPLLGPCELRLEGGDTRRAEGSLPPDLPIGYHELHPIGDGDPSRLIVTPGRCHLPGDLRAWVLSVQLPACRSAESWGIGDLADLRAIGTWAAARGAGMVAVSPLHAPLPLDRIEPSPYFPSSRRWSNPLVLRIEELPGAAGDADVGELAARARRLDAEPIIDRDQVWDLKRRALELLWERAGPDLRLARWRDEMGAELETYARFCALADHHGRGWRDWPPEHRRPDLPGVTAFAAAQADRVAFWAWVQFQVHQQLRRAEEPLPLLTDLAIGVHPDGADAWAMQHMLALDVRVGAPPDEFNRAGQDWGLPPLIPHEVRAAGYAPLASLWRAAMGHGGGLRIDHVMGLFRLYWIPPGGGPADGAYVRYRGDEMLAVLAVESARARAVVAGEDLGTVEQEVRHALGQAGVLSYRLAWFEEAPPEHYPPQALAAVSTHDLPTIAGVWTGEDAADQRAAGIEPDEDALERLRGKLMGLTGLGPDAPVEDVIVATHERLARAPSALVAATMEDCLALRHRPNVPGTTHERPNWSAALPIPLAEVFTDPLVSRVVAAVHR